MNKIKKNDLIINLSKMQAERDYYLTELVKLLSIIKQDSQEIMISKKYLDEKITRIITGRGITIHPTLEEWVKDYIKKNLSGTIGYFR